MSQVLIILFRGVGGATQLPTQPLRQALATAGFGRVATYINSGNAIVTSTMSPPEAVTRIADLVREQFGFGKEIMAVSRPHWSAMIADNPFVQEVCEPTRLHACILAARPRPAAVAALEAKNTGTERFVLRDKILYLHTPDGMGRSRLVPRIETTLGVAATARNWNTVLALEALAAKAGRPG